MVRALQRLLLTRTEGSAVRPRRRKRWTWRNWIKEGERRKVRARGILVGSKEGPNGSALASVRPTEDRTVDRCSDSRRRQNCQTVSPTFVVSCCEYTARACEPSRESSENTATPTVPLAVSIQHGQRRRRVAYVTPVSRPRPDVIIQQQQQQQQQQQHGRDVVAVDRLRGRFTAGRSQRRRTTALHSRKHQQGSSSIQWWATCCWPPNRLSGADFAIMLLLLLLLLLLLSLARRLIAYNSIKLSKTQWCIVYPINPMSFEKQSNPIENR